MPNRSLADRRRHPRAPLAGRLHALTNQAPLSPRILDVSETGARLELTEPLPAGQPLDVTMTIIDHRGRPQSCKVQSEVVRSQGCEVGIRFRRLLPLHLLQLRDYVWRYQSGTPRTSAKPRPRSHRWLSLRS